MCKSIILIKHKDKVNNQFFYETEDEISEKLEYILRNIREELNGFTEFEDINLSRISEGVDKSFDLKEVATNAILNDVKYIYVLNTKTIGCEAYSVGKSINETSIYGNYELNRI